MNFKKCVTPTNGVSTIGSDARRPEIPGIATAGITRDMEPIN